MSRKRNFLLVHMLCGAVLLVVCLFPFGRAEAATYYVDQAHPQASDSNAGTEALPWRTLQRAMSVVAGDTVYVKNGTYLAPNDSNGFFNPANSGTAAAPVAFRAYTPPTGQRHRPVAERSTTPHHDPGFSSPVIAVINRNYIIWDGFATAPFTSVRLEQSTGPVIENMLIDVGAAPDPGVENYDGIFSQQVTNGIIRNNVIRNARYSDTDRQNAAGITLYENQGTRIHNNEIAFCNSGIFDKENGVNNVYEYNYVHNIPGDAFLTYGFVTLRCGTCPVQNNIARNNVIVNANVGVRYVLSNPPTPYRDLHFYNNVVYNVTAGMTTNFEDVPNHRLYNNIVVINPSVGGGHYGFWLSSPPGLVSNYSDFRSLGSLPSLVRIVVAGVVRSLSQWQSFGFDGNSVSVDPLFVGPLTGTPPVTAFRLQAGSPLRGAGRVGGVSTGAPANMGAYLSDSDIVGPGWAADTLPPVAPTGLTVR